MFFHVALSGGVLLIRTAGGLAREVGTPCPECSRAHDCFGKELLQAVGVKVSDRNSIHKLGVESRASWTQSQDLFDEPSGNSLPDAAADGEEAHPAVLREFNTLSHPQCRDSLQCVGDAFPLENARSTAVSEPAARSQLPRGCTLGPWADLDCASNVTYAGD